MGGVFINYRGEDSQTAAPLIDEKLTAQFGSDQVFLDSRSIPIGLDFVEELLGRLWACSVLLVVIGQRWLTLTDTAGGRRIDDPRDWIRWEIVAAFAHGLRVVPVLIDEAQLPAEADLPDDIAALSRCQYVPLRHRYTKVDLAHLVERIVEIDPELAEAARHQASASPAPPLLPAAGSGLPAFPPAVHNVLRAQRVLAEELPYRVLLQGTQPALSAVYVEQRAERHTPDRAETEESKENPAAARRAREQAATLPGSAVGGEPVVRSIPELLRSERHALVVGEPGTGKSTLLQRLIGESARWWLSAPVDASVDAAPFGSVLPVRVSASALIGRPLKDALASGLNAELGAYLDQAFTPDLFMRPPAVGVSWLVLVDGLDEIMDSRTRTALIGALAERLTRQGDLDGDYRLLVTSRPLPEQELAPLRISGVGDWRLRPFDAQDFEAFANGWFRARGSPDVEQEVQGFLERVERSHLQAIVRIPLLAVITAIVHEHSGERALPIGQADLYEEFLIYLLQIRQETVQARLELQERLARYTPSGRDLADWLFEHVRPLLEFLATEFLAGHEGRQSDLATRWTAEHCPDLPRLVPDWAGRVTNLLRGTGVLLEQEGTLRFLHHSFAEYLAAGPAAENLDPPAWHRLVLDPARRNHALFTLARWADKPGHDPTLMVQPLLVRQDDDDLLAAAAVLAHGVTLSHSTETTVVEALLVAARSISGGRDFFGALRALPGRPAVIDGLANLMVNPAAAPSTRVEAARSYAMLTDLIPALSALTGIARDPLCAAADRSSAARALADLGERVTAVETLTSIMLDPALRVHQRVGAAIQLAGLGETSAVLKVLASIASDSTIREEDRVDAANALGDLGEHDTATRLLTSVLDKPHADGLARIWAANGIAKLGKPDIGIKVLLAIVRDPDAEVFLRVTAAQWLAGLNQRAVSIDILAEVARDSTATVFQRVLAAQQLAELGEYAEAQAILRSIAHKRGLWSSDRVYVARAMADAGDRDTAIDILIYLARSVRSGAGTRIQAARKLADLGKRPEATTILRHMIRSWRVSAFHRAYAANALARMGDLARAQAGLRRIARAWYVSGGSRAIAARFLADLGERDVALAVLRRITSGRYVSATSRIEAAQKLAGLGEQEHALVVLRRVARRPSNSIHGFLARADAARALADLGERDVARETLIDMVRFATTDSNRVWAASELAEIGDRETARRELANIVRDLRATPDNRLKAARELSSRWGATSAVNLLKGVANKRDAGTRARIRAASDIAKIRNRALAVITLRSIATDNSENTFTRLAATTVLTYWAVARYARH